MSTVHEVNQPKLSPQQHVDQPNIATMAFEGDQIAPLAPAAAAGENIGVVAYSKGRWRTGLCDCLSDCDSLWASFLCLPITVAQLWVHVVLRGARYPCTAFLVISALLSLSFWPSVVLSAQLFADGTFWQMNVTPLQNLNSATICMVGATQDLDDKLARLSSASRKGLSTQLRAVREEAGRTHVVRTEAYRKCLHEQIFRDERYPNLFTKSYGLLDAIAPPALVAASRIQLCALEIDPMELRFGVWYPKNYESMVKELNACRDLARAQADKIQRDAAALAGAGGAPALSEEAIWYAVNASLGIFFSGMVWAVRHSLRQRDRIPASCGEDLCFSCCCTWCVTSQMMRHERMTRGRYNLCSPSGFNDALEV